jgi:hypothetical protein
VAVARAEAAWLEGDAAPARAVVEDALARAERTKSYAWLAGELAFWLWRLDGPDRLATAGLLDGVAEPFILQMTGAWEAAADHWRALGCTYQAAAALADSDQEPQLRAALTELERLGARPLAAASHHPRQAGQPHGQGTGGAGPAGRGAAQRRHRPAPVRLPQDG